MMTLVINATHKGVPIMHRCLTSSLVPTHLPIASLTPFGHSRAHYLLKKVGCNLNHTTHVISHDYRPSWAQAGVKTNLLL